MKYSLVLQFRGDSLADFDKMVQLEETLTKHLGRSADVDGHDMGSGEINIFIHTTDPVGTFRRAKPVLAEMNRLDKVTAAYRPLDGDNYTVVWPEGSTTEFKIV